MLEVTKAKQELFIERAMFLHKLAVSRASAQATTTLRLTGQQWDAEVELACVGAYVFEKMSAEKDEDGQSMFTAEIMTQCRLRFIEGYFVYL